MTPEERDYRFKTNPEVCEAIIDLLADTRVNVLANFEKANPDALVYLQGQYALLNYLQRFIESAGMALETLQED